MLRKAIFLLLVLFIIVFWDNWFRTPNKRSTWAADGEWIAFSCGIYEQSEIFIIRPDGSDLYQLTHNTYEDSSPHWSPDGQWIVFSSEGSTILPNSYQNDIYRIRPDGSELQNLTHDDRRDSLPNWSQNGTSIIFSSFEVRGETEHDLWQLEIDSGDLTQLTINKHILGSAWSPDGEWIAFDAGRYLYKMRPDSSQQTLLAEATLIGGPSWAPDGRQIVIGFSQSGFGQEIGIVSSDGGEIEQLTSLGGASGSPNWLADGEHIVFTHSGKIYRIGLEEDTPEEIIDILNLMQCGIGSFDWFTYSPG